jgi:hypothetical protein
MLYQVEYSGFNQSFCGDNEAIIIISRRLLRMMIISYNSPILAKQNGSSYEPDSSPLAWEHYKWVYTSKHWPLITEFDLTNIATYSDLYGYEKKNVKYTRLLAGIKQTSPYSIEGKLWSKFTLGGECDFNFNNKKVTQFKKILGESNEFLEYCSGKHHTLLNFSIMAATGGMNNFKGSNPFDRLDTFVYHLNQYFTVNAQLIFSDSGRNMEPLRNFLDTFDDVYDYCKKIYFINDKKFVERIIYEGKMPLEKPEDVIRYMKLAKDFWSKKQKVWNEMKLNYGYPDMNDNHTKPAKQVICLSTLFDD